MNHQHHQCAHIIAYCSSCDAAFCRSCGREWGARSFYPWSGGITVGGFRQNAAVGTNTTYHATATTPHTHS